MGKQELQITRDKQLTHVTKIASEEIEIELPEGEGAIAQLKFGNDVKVLCIPQADYRLICHHLGLDNVQAVATAPFRDLPLITMLVQESLGRFMENEGYVFSGEVNFDQEGRLLPVKKTIWTIGGIDRVFTTGGMMFYENGDKKVVWFSHANTERQEASITCFANNAIQSQEYVHNLEQFARKHNCLRGVKLRDINIFRASFSELSSNPEYVWDNYYYSEEVRDLFQLEVFGFLGNVERYNRRGIRRRGVMLKGKPGTGKCLGAGTPVLMFNGSVKKVENVVAGDLLMGPDSRPRRVTSIARGREQMYRVTPTKGDSYEVNASHVLSLRMSQDAESFRQHEIVNMPVENYLNQTSAFKRSAKGWRTAIDFSTRPVDLDPYWLGIWLGDIAGIANRDEQMISHSGAGNDSLGLQVRHANWKNDRYPTHRSTTAVVEGDISVHPSNPFLEGLKKYNLLDNKHVPIQYKANDEGVRLQVLAGILDTNGYVSGEGFGLSLESRRLLNDVIYVAKSLGFAAYETPRERTCTDSPKHEPWRCDISGDCNRIPTRIKHPLKRVMSQNVLNVGISVEPIGEGDYYGFEIDRDGLFVLGDFTVTHNTTLGHIVCNYAPEHTVIWITPDILTENEQVQMSIKLLYRLAEFLSPVVVFLEDLDLFAEDRSNPKSSGEALRLGALMNIMDGVNSVHNCITIATTNRIELVESALRNRPGRFDRMVEIGPLTKSLRERMFKDRLHDCEYEAGLLNYVVQETEGCTGAECEEFVKTLNLHFINEHEDESSEERIMTRAIVEQVLSRLSLFQVGGETGPGGRPKMAGFAAENEK